MTDPPTPTREVPLHEANMRLRAARRRTESPANPGSCLSRGELADLVAAYVYERHGELLAPDKSWVGKLERGEITWPRASAREALRTILNASCDAELGFVDQRRAILDDEPAELGAPWPGGDWRDPVRAALDGLPPTAVPAHVGEAEVAQVHNAAGVFASWDHAYGSGPTRTAILAQLRWSAGLLGATVPTSLRPRLHSAVGYLAQVCGMVAFDDYAHDDARRILRLALACAEEAEDWHLRAKVYSCLARQAIWVGDPDGGLTHTEQALVRADRLTATERAMLHTARARALARLHQGDAALAAVGAADDAFARTSPPDDPPWMAYYDEAQHNGDTGHALWDLALQGRRCDAATRLAAAVETHGPAYARSRAISQTKLASLSLATADPHEGAALGMTALRLGAAVRSRRLADDLRELARLAEPHASIDPVAELRDGIAAALAA
jgi:hypothetical protein